MSEQVEVTVKLPAPPAGYEYDLTAKIRELGVSMLLAPQPEQQLGFPLRRIQPATVMVELTRDDAEFFAGDINQIPTRARLGEACRAALASNTDIDRRETCGEPFHPFFGDTTDGSGYSCDKDAPESYHGNHGVSRCTLQKNHEGLLHRA